MYRHGNQPGGGGTGMLFYCLLRNDGGHVVVVFVFIFGVLCMCDVTASNPLQPFEEKIKAVKMTQN